MQSKDTRRDGIHTCKHVHGDTTQATANCLTLMLAEKPIADSDAAETLSHGKKKRNLCQEGKNSAKRRAIDVLALGPRPR